MNPLTPREREILAYMPKAGFRQDVAAKELHIAYRTIKAHLANIRRKTGLKSTPSAYVFALNEGWI